MKAMILAAGFGTRLRPLTEMKPKALVPVANKPILARNIEYLISHGITEIIVNAHHHSEQVVAYLRDGNPYGLDIRVKVEPEILGTGGGIKNTEAFWDKEPFFVINSDILTDIDLVSVYQVHQSSGSIVTLVLHDCELYNQVAVDDQFSITDIAKTNSPGRLAFTGIHVIDPEVLSRIPKGVFSDIIECYRELINLKKPVRACLVKGHYWRDIGNIASYLEANRELSAGSFVIGPGCSVDSSVKLLDWGVIGENSRLGKNAELQRSVLWDGVTVREGVKVVDSVVTSGRIVERDLHGKAF
ncbi:MAG: NDP-sugar synthase [Desulfobacterota bacterium]|jgi:NDP-sugar pyrophosphorylase family protein|nr:NDP-sugar synthase [Thermodesulfobacteriota bacterium]